MKLTEIYLEQEINENGLLEKNNFKDLPNVHMCDAPVMKVSSSFIRQAIKDGKDVRYLLTEPVHKYIDEMNFYK